MFLLYMFVLASYASYIMHQKETYLFSDTYSGYSSEYERTLPSYTMSYMSKLKTPIHCEVKGWMSLVRSAESHRTGAEGSLIQLTTESTFGAHSSLVKIDKSNEEYVDDDSSVGSSGDVFGGDVGGGDVGGGDGSGSDYFRPEELAKGRFVKNIKYSYRGMDLHPKHANHREIAIDELYENMEKKRILDTLENIRVPVPNKLQLCDYVKKQYSDSFSNVYLHHLLGGGLLNDGEWEF